MKNKTQAVFFFVLTAILYLADRLSKTAASAFLRGKGEAEVIPGFFSLLYLENRGAAFGMLKDRLWIFIIIACAVSLLCIYAAMRLPAGRKYRPLAVCAAMLMAGALGNMTDRIVYGYVVDFLYLSCIDFPVFNVADVWVCVSCFLLVIFLLFVYKEEDLEFLKRR